MIADSVGRQRFVAVLFAMFAGVTLAIAAAGIYGPVSYTVHRRLREIGIRMALGAGRRQIVSLVAAKGVRLSVVGVGLGVAVQRLLFNADARNPLVLTAVGLILGAVAVASYVPARGAARVNPVTALAHGVERPRPSLLASVSRIDRIRD